MIDPLLVETFHVDVLRKPPPAEPQLLKTDAARAANVAERLHALAAECRGYIEDKMLQRVGYSLEELAEYIDAHIKKCLVAALDGIVDRIFLSIGDAVEQGLAQQLSDAYIAIAQSNLTKTGSEQTGKAMKGPGYRAPTADLEKLLNRKAVQ